MIFATLRASSIASSPSTIASFSPTRFSHSFNGQNTRTECPYFFSIPAARDPIVTGSPIRVISASFCMRFCRYTIFRSKFPDSSFVFSVLPHFCITCVPDAVPVNFTSDNCSVCCSAASSSASEIVSASHSFGVPITYGVPNFS